MYYALFQFNSLTENDYTLPVSGKKSTAEFTK